MKNFNYSIVLLVLFSQVSFGQNRETQYSFAENYEIYCKHQANFKLETLERFDQFYKVSDKAKHIMSQNIEAREADLPPLNDPYYNSFLVRINYGCIIHQLNNYKDQAQLHHFYTLLDYLLEFKKVSKEDFSFEHPLGSQGMPITLALNSAITKCIANVLKVNPEYSYFFNANLALYSSDLVILLNKVIDDALNKIGNHNFSKDQLKKLRQYVNNNWK